MLRLVKGAGKENADEPMEETSKEVKAPGRELNAELSAAIGQLLLPHLGPVARHLVRSIAASCNSLDELAESLSLRIPDPRERTAFLHAVATSNISSLPFRENDNAEGLVVSDGEGDSGAGVAAEETTEALFTREQLNDLTRALAYYVGPLASRLVKANKGKVKSLEELNLVVAKSISDPDDWARFLMTRRKKN